MKTGMKEQRIIVTGLISKSMRDLDVISSLMMQEKETLVLRHSILTMLSRSSKVSSLYWTSRSVTNWKAFKPSGVCYQGVFSMKGAVVKDLDILKLTKKCGMIDLAAIRTHLYMTSIAMPRMHLGIWR